jgi:hypothetical protein
MFNHKMARGAEIKILLAPKENQPLSAEDHIVAHRELLNSFKNVINNTKVRSWAGDEYHIYFGQKDEGSPFHGDLEFMVENDDNQLLNILEEFIEENTEIEDVLIKYGLFIKDVHSTGG